MTLSRSFLLVGAALLAPALLPSPASAQQPRGGYYTYHYGYNPGYYAGGSRPTYPPSPRGGADHAPQLYVARRASASAPEAQHNEPANLAVSVRWSGTGNVVAIRGPDNTVRYFTLKNGPATVQVRSVTLHPGESLVINLARPGTTRTAVH